MKPLRQGASVRCNLPASLVAARLWRARSDRVRGIGSSSASAGIETGGQSAAFPSRTADGQPDMQGLWRNMCQRAAGLPAVEPRVHRTTSERWALPGRRVRPISGSAPARRQLRRQPDTRSAIVDPPNQILPYPAWRKPRRDAVMKDYLHPSPAEVDTNSRGWPTRCAARKLLQQP